jgi:hypothetical protein
MVHEHRIGTRGLRGVLVVGLVQAQVAGQGHIDLRLGAAPVREELRRGRTGGTAAAAPGRRSLKSSA